MERIFVRSEAAAESDFRAASRVNVGIVGLCAGAGSTFVSTSIAYLASRDKRKSVAFVEAADYLRGAGEPRSRLFDSMGADKRFAFREYIDLFEVTERGGSIRSSLNVDDRINWAVPVDAANCDSNVFLRVAGSVAGDTIICDIGSSLEGDNLRAALSSMDIIVCVADPAPSSLIAGEKRLYEIKKHISESGVKLFTVINKMSAGVDKRGIRKFLGVPEILTIEAVPASEIHGCEYACRLPAESKSIRTKLQAVERIVNEL